MKTQFSKNLVARAAALAALGMMIAAPASGRPPQTGGNRVVGNGVAVTGAKEDAVLREVYRECMTRQAADAWANDHAVAGVTRAIAAKEGAWMSAVMDDLVRVEVACGGRASFFEVAGGSDSATPTQLTDVQGMEVDRQFLLGLIQDSVPIEVSLGAEARREFRSGRTVSHDRLANDMKVVQQLRDSAGVAIVALETPGPTALR